MTRNKMMFSLSEFYRRYGADQHSADKKIRVGRLRVQKLGVRPLVSRDAPEDWLCTLPKTAAPQEEEKGIPMR